MSDTTVYKYVSKGSEYFDFAFVVCIDVFPSFFSICCLEESKYSAPFDCYWGVEELGLTSKELCPRLLISQQAVSKWVKKGCAHLCSESLTFDDLIL